MEKIQQIVSASLMLPVTPVKQGKPDDNSSEECRNLLRALTGRTEILCRECRSDKDNTTHIRTMGPTLETLAALVRRDTKPRICHTPDILEDARGFTYRSVRSCDLERISYK
jgi:hypothetical protein